MSALPLTNMISQSSVVSRVPRVTVISFNNGYEQRSIDGNNPFRDEWSLIFENLSTSQLTTLMTFFDTTCLGGVYYFTWTAYIDSVSKNWVQNGKYQITPKAGNIFDLTVPIKQVYDL